MLYYLNVLNAVLLLKYVDVVNDPRQLCVDCVVSL